MHGGKATGGVIDFLSESSRLLVCIDFFRDAIAGQASTRICGRRGDRRYNKALA